MFTTLISAAELRARSAQPGLVICDVRHDLAAAGTWGAAQYALGHIPGAVFVHLDRDLSGPQNGRNGRHPLPSPEVFARRLGELGIGADTQVVAYDHGPGMYAARLWWMLRWLGHETVAVLDGGLAAWKRDGGAVETTTPNPVPATFPIRRVSPTVSASGVMASLARGGLLLLDARAPERFRGDVEPQDPVAGHIPGSRNRPFASNLNADGVFKSAVELRADFSAVLEGRGIADVVHSCGSGVTACHNILAMEVAGMNGTRLYPGSWSEWCAEPSRPLAKGDSVAASAD